MSSSLFDELDSVSTTLCDILAKYVDACAKLRDHYFRESVSSKLDKLLGRVANELELVASYGSRLKQAESSMKVVRNSSPSTVPISVLPPEILARIFHIVVDDQPEPFDTTHAPFQVALSFPKYPETLSHVCSRWRQVSITSHALWTRVDLVLHHPLGPGFLARAKTHVDRVGELPLDVHMFDPTRRQPAFRYCEPHKFEDFDFLAFAETPMSALKLTSCHGLHDEHYNFICYCILNCAQQTLKHLVIRNTCDRAGSHCFIESTYDPHDPNSLQIDLSAQLLEGFWCSTSVLHLAGLYPYWTSRAYHHLVDLRLGSDRLQGRVPITEAQMIGILKSSPGLRVFHLRLELMDALPDNAPTSVIRLDELESLNLSSPNVNPSQVLRHIIPGQKPLQLSIYDQPTDVVEQFLMRSNVTQLRMVYWETYPPVNALCLCPNLRVLVLDVWGNIKHVSFQTTPEQDGEGILATPIPIQTLYILRCEGMDLAELQQIVEKHSVQELTLWNTYPKVNTGHNSGGREAYESDVSALCPVVNYLSGRDESPMVDWDLF